MWLMKINQNAEKNVAEFLKNRHIITAIGIILSPDKLMVKKYLNIYLFFWGVSAAAPNLSITLPEAVVFTFCEYAKDFR